MVKLTFLSLMTRFFLVYVSMYDVMVQIGQFDLFVFDDAILFGVCKYVQRKVQYVPSPSSLPRI